MNKADVKRINAGSRYPKNRIFNESKWWAKRHFVIDEPNNSVTFRDNFFAAMHDMLKACTIGKKKPTLISMDNSYHDYFLQLHKYEDNEHYCGFHVLKDKHAPLNTMLFINGDDAYLKVGECLRDRQLEKIYEEIRVATGEMVFPIIHDYSMVCSDSRLHGVIASKKGVDRIKIIDRGC